MGPHRLVSGLTATMTVAAAVAIGGCGAARSVSQVVDPVAQAADVTATVPGYRIAGTITVGLGSTGATGHATMSGVMDRTTRAGSVTVQESVAGRSVTTTEKFAGTTVYMNAADLGGSAHVPGGKPWIEYDMGRAMGSMGLGGLSTTSSDPSQFVDYLRAAGANATRVGTQTIRGVAATHYRVMVSLDRYPKLVAPADRTAAARGVSVLESALGSHTIPMDVWVDHQKLVRRLSFAFVECVENQRLKLGMTMDLYDYGPQPQPSIPSASESYDITPQLEKLLKNAKLGCSSA